MIYMLILDIIGNSQVEGVTKQDWTWGNRLAVVGLWPVFVAVFIYYFINPKTK